MKTIKLLMIGLVLGTLVACDLRQNLTDNHYQVDIQSQPDGDYLVAVSLDGEIQTLYHYSQEEVDNIGGSEELKKNLENIGRDEIKELEEILRDLEE